MNHSSPSSVKFVFKSKLNILSLLHVSLRVLSLLQEAAFRAQNRQADDTDDAKKDGIEPEVARIIAVTAEANASTLAKEEVKKVADPPLVIRCVSTPFVASHFCREVHNARQVESNTPLSPSMFGPGIPTLTRILSHMGACPSAAAQTG